MRALTFTFNYLQEKEKTCCKQHHSIILQHPWQNSGNSTFLKMQSHYWKIFIRLSWSGSCVKVWNLFSDISLGDALWIFICCHFLRSQEAFIAKTNLFNLKFQVHAHIPFIFHSPVFCVGVWGSVIKGVFVYDYDGVYFVHFFLPFSLLMLEWWKFQHILYTWLPM